VFSSVQLAAQSMNPVFQEVWEALGRDWAKIVAAVVQRGQLPSTLKLKRLLDYHARASGPTDEYEVQVLVEDHEGALVVRMLAGDSGLYCGSIRGPGGVLYFESQEEPAEQQQTNSELIEKLNERFGGIDE
jgi:hypothetical protein